MFSCDSPTGFHIEHSLTSLQSEKSIDLRGDQAKLIREAMDDFNRAGTMTLKSDMPNILLPSP